MKGRSHFPALIFIFFLNSQFLVSQHRELIFERYSLNDGLSHNTVHCIAQDEKGFLWIGTEHGLNLFDGYSFMVFNKNEKDPTSIPDNFINSLYFDKTQNLWIGTNSSGLCRYNKWSRDFTTFSSFRQGEDTLMVGMITAITEDSKGHLWLGTFGGLLEFDPVAEKFVSHPGKAESRISLSDDNIRSLFMDKDDVLWIGTNQGGLNCLNLRSQAIRYFSYEPSNAGSLSNNSVSSILRDHSGKLWIGTSWGLNLYDEERNCFRRIVNDLKDPSSISANAIYSILEDPQGSLWIGTINGLNWYDREKDSFYSWKYISSINPSLFDNHIFVLFEDSFGQMWFGTATKGLGKFNNRIKKFRHILIEPAKWQEQSGDNIVREIFEDSKGQVWLGVLNRGLYRYELKSGKLQGFLHNPADRTSISDNRVNTVFEDSKGNLWVGTWDGGLNLAYKSKDTYHFSHISHDPSDPGSLASNVVQEIAEDPWGRLWIGTEGGLDLFNPSTQKATHFRNDPENHNSLASNSVQSGCIHFSGQHVLWVGTWGGLSRIELSADTHLPVRFSNYKQGVKNQPALSENRVIALHLDKKSNLWVGTYGGGLNKLILNDKMEVQRIEYFTEREGLSNNVVFGILEDEQGILWISTNDGLSKFDPATGKFVNFTERDGLQSNQFFWGAACKLKSGELAFGGVNGLNTFKPDEISPDNDAPRVVITDFKIFNERPQILAGSKLNKNIVYADTVFLDYTDKLFSIEFASIQFSDPSRNKYAYKLEGFNQTWIETDARKRFAVFTNLDPGEYLFKVKGSNADEVWNEKGTQLRIIIKPPFYMTGWFRGVAALSIILLLYLIYRGRVSSLRAQKHHLELKVKEKTAEVSLRNEELKATNEEIVVSNEELDKQRKELEETLHSLRETQKQLIQSEKMASLGVLSAGVAHEINNPLNFIQAGITGLETYFNENLGDHLKEVDPMITGIKVGVQRASNIVTSLNHYSRSDESPRVRSHVHTIIENCLTMLQNQTKHRIEIQKKYMDTSDIILCNESKLHQAFLNVLSNAIHAIEREGRITIETRMKKATMQILISDTGNGISPENLERIMDPFFTTKEPGKGTGLGLSITYNIIQEHKGEIVFQSEVNVGTQVRITLPASQ